jgi:hypothetical protein
MAEHIDNILRKWAFDPQTLSVRQVKGKDGRPILQMRVDLGVLQLESDGRPDGERPHGYESYYDYLLALGMRAQDGFRLSDDHCREIDREFVQFYHRRICWLRLQDYRRALKDAQHTLALMDFCQQHSDDERWIMSHEQYRPFVLMHRTQAEALTELEDGDGFETALQAIDHGLGELFEFFSEHGAEESFEEDEIVQRLREFRESLLEQFDDRFKLGKELEAAIAAEEYERAAEIRDQLNRLNRHSQGR